MKRTLFLINIVLILLCVFLIGSKGNSYRRAPSIFLPGTQPGVVDTVDSVQVCKACHQSSSKPVTIYNDWRGSPMANAARDPIFYAAVAAENKYEPSTGEFCIRCHSPSGWLIGHSLDARGKALVGSDLDGIQCDFCHRLGNPLQPDSGIAPLTFPVPGYGNGMNVLSVHSTPKRGPYADTNAYHPTTQFSFIKSSSMCANCHDISNPFHATDRVHQAPQEYSPLERTFSEWQLSDFSSSADSITCQGCHMQQSPGYGSFFSSTPLRSDLRQHDLTGGNTFLADILPDFWSNLDSSTLAQGKQRAETTLQRAATLDVSTIKYPDSVVAVARVINLTGHKLPTGYPEGRRMWLNVVALNANGDTVFQSGEYDTSTATLSRDGQLKLYEIKFGLTDSMATRYGLTPGESFHFSLNDTILFDNRIPPKGFTNSKYVSRLASPVGYSYADSQYWDETRYLLPANAVRVTVNLFYQTISKEYIEFLRNENVDNSYDWNSWGDKLYTSWLTHGKSQPFVMATSTKTITGTKSGEGLPSSFKLYQNFPNPFNPSTDLKLENKNSGFVSLKIFDVLGNEIAVLLNEKKPPGSYTVTWNAAGQPSGIYFARCSLNGIEQTIKLVLVR